jgi:hypothetical protein
MRLSISCLYTAIENGRGVTCHERVLCTHRVNRYVVSPCNSTTLDEPVPPNNRTAMDGPVDETQHCPCTDYGMS